MTESNLYIWQTGPGQWMARHIVSGQAAVGQTREEALQLFTTVWADRAPMTIVDHAPPFLRRPENAPQEDRLLGADTDSHFRRALLSHFHSDHQGQRRRFSADEIVAVINKLWAER